MKKKCSTKTIIESVIFALLGTISLNIIYCVPSETDAYNAISYYLTSIYIDGLDPWSGSMNFFLTILGKLGNNFFNLSFSYFILFAFLFWAFYSILKKGFFTDFSKKQKVSVYAVSLLLGYIQVMGHSIHHFGNLSFCINGTYQIILSVIIAAGYATLFILGFTLLDYLFRYIREQAGQSIESQGLVSLESMKKEIVVFGVILFVIYLVWILVYFPGSVDWDSHGAVDFFLTGQMNQHHPVLSTWLHVGTLLIGRAMGNDGIGVAIYVILQFLVTIYAFCKVIWVEQKMGCRRFVRITTFLFYGLIPIFGMFIQSVVKNTLFMAVFTIFICNLAEVLLLGDTERITFFRLGVSSFISCLLLHNGKYVIMIALFVLMISKGIKKRIKTFILLFACLLIANIGFDAIIDYGFEYDKISENGSGEAYSLPILCTAYYIKSNPDSLTDEEQQIFSKVFSCTPSELSEGYIRGLSDGVKGQWNNEALTKDKMAYFLLWIKDGIKHPVTYMEAILNQSYGYYTIVPTENAINAQKEVFFDYQMNYSEDSYHVEYLMPPTVRNSFSAFAHFFEQNSITGVLTNLGLTTCLIIMIGLLIIIYRRWNALPFIWISLLYILTCIASPVNANLRYYLPIFAIMPLIWSLVNHPQEIISGEDGIFEEAKQNDTREGCAEDD